MLSNVQLREIMPKLPAAKLPTLLTQLNSAMAEYAIDSAARVAAFVAQLAHESGEFRYMEEIWGPTDAQRRYEPPATLAARLGNTQPGDGRRFKGRGPIQLTGRANYQRFGQLLGVDLVATPERAASPEVAFRIAALYWANRGLNPLADAGDFREITRRINGGFNGLVERTKYFERAKTALAELVSKALPGRITIRASVPEEELLIGIEAVREFGQAARRRTKASSRRSKASSKSPRRTTAKSSKRKVAAKKTSTRKAAATKSLIRGPVAKRKVGKRTRVTASTKRRTGVRR